MKYKKLNKTKTYFDQYPFVRGNAIHTYVNKFQMKSNSGVIETNFKLEKGVDDELHQMVGCLLQKEIIIPLIEQTIPLKQKGFNKGQLSKITIQGKDLEKTILIRNIHDELKSYNYKTDSNKLLSRSILINHIKYSHPDQGKYLNIDQQGKEILIPFLELSTKKITDSIISNLIPKKQKGSQKGNPLTKTITKKMILNNFDMQQCQWDFNRFF